MRKLPKTMFKIRFLWIDVNVFPSASNENISKPLKNGETFMRLSR